LPPDVDLLIRNTRQEAASKFQAVKFSKPDKIFIGRQEGTVKLTDPGRYDSYIYIGL